MSSSPTSEDLVPKETGEDPRAALAKWANKSDEWLRYIARQVIATSRELPVTDIDYAYNLFRQEKLIDTRILDAESELAVTIGQDEAEEPLAISKLSEVRGVNALVPGAVIEPHAGLTILFGENGTGKTGYARVLKALANSRTADTILGDIAAHEEVSKSAVVDYTLGTETHQVTWAGEQGLSPFTRMSIFDSPAVNVHLDTDLEYVYVPAVLSLFNYVSHAIRAVQKKLDQDIANLKTAIPGLLTRFPRESSVYPQIETLSAATDLEALRKLAAFGDEPKTQLDHLVQAVAALEANTVAAQLPVLQRLSTVLGEAETAAEFLSGFDATTYNENLSKLAALRADQTQLREQLFVAASLPAAPDDSWSAFIATGEAYKQHLQSEGVHDEDRCLYCRQPLAEPALVLLARYSEYLEDKLSGDIKALEKVLSSVQSSVKALIGPGLLSFLSEQEALDERAPQYTLLAQVKTLGEVLKVAVGGANPVEPKAIGEAAAALAEVQSVRTETVTLVEGLQKQLNDRTAALKEKKGERVELAGRVELAAVWEQVESKVKGEQLAARITILVKKMAVYLRQVTELAKSASDQLINQSFDALFAEECKHLRAPALDVQFVGREGKPHRRRTLGGSYKPSKVLSEGEQKVLAIADFLAEARLTGITAPIVFDDPVSSLDHRRINEVANRIASLTDNNQVIVFTHDILFATKLLSLFEKSKRCVYYAVTDDGGKGQVATATGPRLDSIGDLRKRINMKIAAAEAVDGEARDALIREGYSCMRSWCEVFTEDELLNGVTRRYQPNVRMTTLPDLKLDAMGPPIEVVFRIFEEACRQTEAHSQPLLSLGTSATLADLKAHWAELEACRDVFRKA